MTRGGRDEAALEAARSLQVQLEERDRNLQQKESLLAAGEQQLRQHGEEVRHLNEDIQRLNQDVQQLEREKNRVIQEIEQQLGRVNDQLEESGRVIADFERRVVELEGQLCQRDQRSCRGDRSGANNRTEIKLRWREGEKAPCEMERYCDAVVGAGVVYFIQFSTGNDKILAYHTTTSKWSLIPHSPVYSGFTLAVCH